MTGRVSTNMTAGGVQMNLRRQEVKVNKANGQMGSQNRIQELRDDPIAAGHLVRYQSYLSRVNTFENNAKVLSDEFSIREGYMNSSLDMMQRVRELAVTGANYDAVTPETGANPKEEGWYERSGSAGTYVYTLTTDTTVGEGKTYYAKSDARLASAAKTALAALGFKFVSEPTVTRPY